MTSAVTSEMVDHAAKTIRDCEDRREALRARLFGAHSQPDAPAELIAELETAVRSLDAEIKELKAARLAASVPEELSL